MELDETAVGKQPSSDSDNLGLAAERGDHPAVKLLLG